MALKIVFFTNERNLKVKAFMTKFHNLLIFVEVIKNILKTFFLIINLNYKTIVCYFDTI